MRQRSSAWSATTGRSRTGCTMCDRTFDEDRSQVRTGSIHQVMATCRNTAIGLLRLAGHDNMARATRRCAARPWEALALLGIEPPTFE